MGIHKSKALSLGEMELLKGAVHGAEKASDLKRIQCVYLRGKGLRIGEIAEVTQYSIAHIKSVWTAYFRGGLEELMIKPRGGRRRFNLTLEEEKELLSRYARGGEQGMMLEISPLYEGLKAMVGEKVSLTTAYRMAHRHGWRKIAPRPRHPGKQAKAAEYFKIFFPKLMEEIKSEADQLGLPLRVMFQDEARFGRISDPRRCWAPKGIRPHVPSQIIREYTYLYGAVTPKDGEADFLILPSMDIANMEFFLNEVRERHKNGYICMFVDGAPGHSLKGLKVPENMVIEKIPAYSPDVNPAENLWDDIREKYFGNIVFDSMAAVKDRLCEAAIAYETNPKRNQSIAGWHWILSAL